MCHLQNIVSDEAVRGAAVRDNTNVSMPDLIPISGYPEVFTT